MQFFFMHLFVNLAKIRGIACSGPHCSVRYNVARRRNSQGLQALRFKS